MNITIVQAEIEQAIRDYIGSRIKVAEGNQMTIELAATRGTTGFTAQIDISPVTTPAANSVGAAAVAAPVAQPAASVETNVSFLAPQRLVVRTPEAVRAMMAAEAEATAEPAVAEPAVVAAEAATVELPAEGAAEVPASAETPASDARPAEASARSLFSGLKRPKGS